MNYLSIQSIRKFFTETDGATAIEYALIVTFISAVIITALTAVGLNLAAFFTGLAGKFIVP